MCDFAANARFRKKYLTPLFTFLMEKVTWEESLSPELSPKKITHHLLTDEKIMLYFENAFVRTK